MHSFLPLRVVYIGRM